MARPLKIVSLCAAMTLFVGLGASAFSAPPAHLVLVIEENHGFSQIIGSPDCPYINALALKGALLTRSYAVGHPSEPNYLALLSGSTWDVADDTCPPPGSPYPGDNLGSLLRAAGLSFVGYCEDLPKMGSTDCSNGAKSGYRRKHNSWVDFANLPRKRTGPFPIFPMIFPPCPLSAWSCPTWSTTCMTALRLRRTNG